MHRTTDEAEFTPRNVQTVESRKTTVFAVDLALEPSAGRLKPGMPADVVFAAAQVGQSGQPVPQASRLTRG